MKCWGITDSGKVRAENQDSFFAELYIPETGIETAVAVVCDGMGGAKAGNVASSIAVETYVKAVKEGLDKDEDKKNLIKKSVLLANEAVYSKGRSNDAYRGMGTTLVSALMTAEHCYVVNIGDSRCYCAGREGIYQVTKDHSLVEDMIDRGELMREDARRHPNKNYITRALGTEMHSRCDIYELELKEGDYLLLCSDGLSNVVNQQEMLFELIHAGGVEGAEKRLLDIALNRGAPDNVTVVILEK